LAPIFAPIFYFYQKLAGTKLGVGSPGPGNRKKKKEGKEERKERKEEKEEKEKNRELTSIFNCLHLWVGEIGERMN
jgi:hypothetical protein